MRNFPTPVVVVSKCLGFAACRWNGITLSEKIVEDLKPFVEYRPVCPEVEIGLGVPRDPIRVVSVKNDLHLMQPATGRDVGQEMSAFARAFLDSVGEVDGFLLKSRSPSCGTRDVKVYPSTEKSAALSSKGRGFLGSAVIERFGDAAVEDEARLSDFRIRWHFLTKLFALAEMRNVAALREVRALMEFHARHKYLLMAYSHAMLRELGRVVANHERLPMNAVLALYRKGFLKALARVPKFTSNINALMHAFGHISDGLSKGEKGYFLDELERYRKGRIPLSVPLAILRSHVERFDNEYLRGQAFFEPYPEVLVSVTDSGKGRER